MTDDTLTVDVPFPGMPEPPELWAVHIQGPDEIQPFLDKAKAEKLVGCLDALDAQERKQAKEHPVFFNAKLIPWPGTRNDFAEAMREEDDL